MTSSRELDKRGLLKYQGAQVPWTRRHMVLTATCQHRRTLFFVYNFQRLHARHLTLRHTSFHYRRCIQQNCMKFQLEVYQDMLRRMQQNITHLSHNTD